MELSNTQPGGTKDPPKSRPEASTRARRRPRVFMKLAKGAQETPKSVQELPKSSPSAAKTRPRQVWEAHRPLRKRTRQAPRRVLATIVIGSLLRQGAGTFFHDLWHCARCLRSVLRPTKTMVLSHAEHFDHTSAHARKNDANKALEHPQVIPKPSQIHRKSKKNRRKSLKKTRWRKMRPTGEKKCEKIAKQSPTWPQEPSQGRSRKLTTASALPYWAPNLDSMKH